MNRVNVRIVPKGSDDPEFISKVERVALGAISAYQPDDLFLTQVKGWFDHKWLKFSGKVLGAVGVWKNDVTVPPFNPNRILEERRFVRTSEEWREVATSIHVHQGSSENLKRTLRQFSASGFFMWFTGETLKNGKGSIMGYSTHGQDGDAWFVAFEKKPTGWKASRHDGISPRMFGALSHSI